VISNPFVVLDAYWTEEHLIYIWDAQINLGFGIWDLGF